MQRVENAEKDESHAARVIESLKAHIAILNGNGEVLETNAAWRDFARCNGMTGCASSIGVNYLDLCDRAKEGGDGDARSVAAGIRAVLCGDSEAYEIVYPCHSPLERRWYLLQVNRLTGGGPGAVVLSHNNVSKFKLAEEALAKAQQCAEALAAAIAEKERFVKGIADNLPGMVAYWDKDLRCRFANHVYLEWFGRLPEAMLGITMQDLMGERLFALNEPYIRKALAGEKLHFERTLTKVDGSIGYTLAHYIPDINPLGAVDGFSVLVSDVTPLKKAEFELKLAASVYQNTLEGIFVTNIGGAILSVNPAFTAITGYTAEDAIGQSPRILNSNQHDPGFYAAIWQDLAVTGHWQGEIWNRRKNGELYLGWQAITSLPGSADEPVRYLSVFSDITELRRKSEKIKHLAFYDALTDLPNRSLLMNRLEHHVAKAKREQHSLALMFLDLDQFKFVNDMLGHDVGDDLLKRVAQKLQAQVRQSDTVARLGGDEFVILLDKPANQEELADIASRIVADIQEPMDFHTKIAQVGISIGIAVYPIDGLTPSQLIKSADLAMYAAKGAGRNTYRFVEA
ncbi:bifunctional diguanylate cyclase/phosphodiesterase [Rhodoferax ferrireducens]|uniref:sensor domain-containing protein n=1 Tax=Rhodoferax ferrireducens TaxID=192843 RepID=UPI0018E55F8E|nr:sensor domain-containing diguanylate cyclase [Rhodoferax ferrireducens]